MYARLHIADGARPAAPEEACCRGAGEGPACREGPRKKRLRLSSRREVARWAAETQTSSLPQRRRAC